MVGSPHVHASARHRRGCSRRLVLLAGALVAVLGLAACADDDDSGAPTGGAGPAGVTAAGGSTDQAGQSSPDGSAAGATAADGAVDGAATGATAADGTPVGSPSDTASTGDPNGQAPAPTRDLSGHDLCPAVDKAAISQEIGVPIGLAESNPSYADPNCVYYRENAGQAVSVTRAPGDYFDEQTQATEAVDGVGDEASWSAPQSTLFVKDGDATWIVSVFQVADDKTAQIRTVAEAVGTLFVAA